MAADPGWRSAVLRRPFMMSARSWRRSPSANGLLELRRTFLALSTGLTLIILVLSLVLGDSDSSNVGAWLIITAAAGVVSWLFATVVFDRSLPCDDTLAKRYGQRFFRRVAFGEMPALVGFVASISSNHMAPYLVGFGFAIVMFVRLAPTQSNIARDQARLFELGCGRDLSAEIQDHWPPTR